MTDNSQDASVARAARNSGLFRGWASAAIAFAVLSVVVLASTAWVPWNPRLPSDRQARAVFDERRFIYLRVAAMLQKEQCVGEVLLDGSSDNSTCSIPFATRRALMRDTGAKFLILGGDKSIEFVLWGTGCAICSDSYEGIRYRPADTAPDQLRGWAPVVARSLEADHLPKANGAVSDGLYLLPIDRDWAIFRLEINE